MEKFDEINEDNIWDISHDDLKTLALSGKKELMGSRSVIWGLNKQIKESGNGENNAWEFNQEAFDQHYTKKQTEEKFNNFLNENNLDDGQKETAKKQFDSGYSLEDITKLSWATSFDSNQNNSNRMGIWGWESGSGQMFQWKLPYWEYNQLDKAGKDAYKSFSRGKFGGLAFDRSSRNDD